jgi:hypothetical protein
VALSFLFSPHIVAFILEEGGGDYFMMLQVARLCSNAGFEVLTVVARKSSIFQDITPHRLIIVDQYFGGTYSLCLLLAGFLCGSLSDPEDGDDMFF